ncbi:MAG: M16 family metallopeptidase [Planctomycetota bacterium]
MQTSESTETRPTAHQTPGSDTTATTSRVFPYTAQKTTLENGLRVILIPMPSDGLVSYWSVVRTGSRDEVEEGVTGFAHFFEHMMFRGTEKLPGKAYDRIVNGIGADANAFTTDDYTAYHLSFSKDDLAKVVEIEADRFQNLKYDEGQFKTESGAVYGEYRKGRTNPFEVLFEAIQNTAFDKHTYKHTTIGFEADIQRMPEQFEYSKTFFQRHYRPENVAIVVTGDFDAKTALETIRTNYSGWKKGYTAPKVPVEPPQTAARRVVVPYDYSTLPIVTVNFKGDAFRPTDRTMVAGLLLGELGFGKTSPIYGKLVLDDQKVEDLETNFDRTRDMGLWSVFAMVKDTNDVPAIEAEIWAAIEDLRTNKVDQERLDAVRSRIKYSFLSRMSTPDEVASALSRFVALTGDIECVDQSFTTLMQITPDDVFRAANTYLQKERSTVAILHSKDMPIPTDADTKAVAVPSSAKVASKNARMAQSKTATATTLETGARVTQKPVLLPVPQDPMVSFKIWFQAGSQNDPVGKEGLAALTGDMLSEGGTQRLTYAEILDALFPIAANYGVSVDKEMTVVSGQVHKDNVAAFETLFVEAITEPGFRESDFQRIRARAISYIENELRSSSDEELGKAALYEQAFQGTRYAHIDTGTVASLKSITLDDVKNFYKTFYTRDTVVVGLGGGYGREMPERLSMQFGRLPRGEKATAPAITPTVATGRHVTLVEKEGPTTAISFGYPIDLHRGSRDFYAMWIANSWLGEHRNSSSHLYQVIRETRGMNYGNYSYIESFPQGGFRSQPPTGVGRKHQIFEVWVRPVAREHALFALRAALREVEKLATNGMTKEDFEFTKRFLKGYSLHFAERTSERLGYAIDDRFFGTDRHLATFRKMMDEITLDEVNAAVKKYLRADNLHIAMVTGGAEEMKAALIAGEPSPITYPKGITKPDDVLAEDKEIERFPLSINADNVTIRTADTLFEGASG